jgi:hypothetical protein
MQRAGSPNKTEGPATMTKPPAPDDGPAGNGQLGSAPGAGRSGEDLVEVQRARLAALWALVLRRFRAHVHGGAATANGDCHEEGG